MPLNLSSLDRFAWLFSPTAPVPDITPSAQDLEDCAWVLLRSWQVLPCVLPKYLSWLGDAPPNALVLARAKAIRALAQLQNRTWLKLSQQFHSEGIPYVLLKSGVLRWLCYPNPTDRCGFDVDIGVPKNHLARAQALVDQNGFQASQWLEDRQQFEQANPILKALTEMVHYELGFLVCRTRVTGLRRTTLEALELQKTEIPNLWHFDELGAPHCYVVLDIHHGISREISVEDMVSSRQSFVKGGHTFYAPPLAWIAFHLIFKIYWEGVHNYDLTAYQYADLCRLLPFMNDAAAEDLIDLLQRWQMEAGGFFVLKRIHQAFSVSLPAPLEAFVESAATPNRAIKPQDQNDLGDMWGKIWGGR